MSVCECSDGRRGSLRPMSVNSAVSCSRDLRARLDGETCLLIQYSILRAFFSSSSLNLIFSRLQLTYACLRRFGPHRRDKMCLNETSECEWNEGRRRSRRRLMSVGSAVRRSIDFRSILNHRCAERPEGEARRYNCILYFEYILLINSFNLSKSKLAYSILLFILFVSSICCFLKLKEI